MRVPAIVGRYRSFPIGETIMSAKQTVVSAVALEMGKLITESAQHDLAVIGLRNKLKVMSQQVFKKPLTVADAAAKLGLNISVKDLDKDAISERATVQRVRVTLERALKDGERYLKVEGKGRKARTTEGENDSSEGGSAGDAVISSLKAAASSRDKVNAILTALDGLSAAQLTRIENKLRTMLASVTKAPAKPAATPRKAANG